MIAAVRACRAWVLILAAACGPTSPTGPVDGSPFLDGSGASVDARTGRTDSRPPPPCTPSPYVEESYGDLPGLFSANDPWDSAAQEWRVSFNLESSGGPVGEIRLHPGRGQLGDPIVPGAYVIGEADSRMEDCAVCVFIHATKPGGTAWFMAEAGELTLLGIEFGDVVDVIEGSLVEVAYKSVALSPSGSSCDNDSHCQNTTCADNDRCEVQQPTTSCGTTLARMSFRTP